MSSRWQSVALAAAFGILVLATVRPPVLTADAARDFLFARDCVELGRCHGLGVHTSVFRLDHTSFWSALIALVELSGGGVRAVQGVVIFLQAVALGAVHRSVAATSSSAAAFAAAVVFAAFLLAAGDQITLWNPSTLALPTVLSGWAIHRLALSRQRVFAILAALAVAVVAQAHVGVALGILPSLVVATLAFAGAPAATLLVVLTALTGTLAVTCSDALAAIAHEAPRSTAVWMALGASVVTGGVARRAFRRATPRLREWVAALLVGGPVLVGQMWLSRTGRAEFALRYLYPAAVVLAVIMGRLAARSASACASRWPATRSHETMMAGLFASPLLALVSGTHGRENVRWTFADLPAIAARNGSRSFEETKRGLQGIGCFEVAAGLSLVTPRPNGSAPSSPPDLLALKFPRGAFGGSPAGIELLPAPGGAELLLRELPSALDRAHGEVCYEPLTPGVAPVCASLGDDPTEHLPPSEFLFATRSYPAVHALHGTERYTARYVIPVRRDVVGRRFITLTDRDTDTACPWIVEPPPGATAGPREVAFEPKDGGELVFRRTFAGCLDTHTLPCFVESREEETWLRALVHRESPR